MDDGIAPMVVSIFNSICKCVSLKRQHGTHSLGCNVLRNIMRQTTAKYLRDEASLQWNYHPAVSDASVFTSVFYDVISDGLVYMDVGPVNKGTYLAISHIWHDTGVTGLPKHRLFIRGLQFARVHSDLARRLGVRLIWLDLISIDQTSDFAIRDATYAMSYIFAFSKHTVVSVESELQVESWMGSTWTVQEAVYSEDLVVYYRETGMLIEKPELGPDYIKLRAGALTCSEAVDLLKARKGGWELDKLYALRHCIPHLRYAPCVYDRSAEQVVANIMRMTDGDSLVGSGLEQLAAGSCFMTSSSRKGSFKWVVPGLGAFLGTNNLLISSNCIRKLTWAEHADCVMIVGLYQEFTTSGEKLLFYYHRLAEWHNRSLAEIWIDDPPNTVERAKCIKASLPHDSLRRAVEGVLKALSGEEVCDSWAIDSGYESRLIIELAGLGVEYLVTQQPLKVMLETLGKVVTAMMSVMREAEMTQLTTYITTAGGFRCQVVPEGARLAPELPEPGTIISLGEFGCSYERQTEMVWRQYDVVSPGRLHRSREAASNQVTHTVLMESCKDYSQSDYGALILHSLDALIRVPQWLGADSRRKCNEVNRSAQNAGPISLAQEADKVVDVLKLSLGAKYGQEPALAILSAVDSRHSNDPLGVTWEVIHSLGYVPEKLAEDCGRDRFTVEDVENHEAYDICMSLHTGDDGVEQVEMYVAVCELYDSVEMAVSNISVSDILKKRARAEVNKSASSNRVDVHVEIVQTTEHTHEDDLWEQDVDGKPENKDDAHCRALEQTRHLAECQVKACGSLVRREGNGQRRSRFINNTHYKKARRSTLTVTTGHVDAYRPVLGCASADESSREIIRGIRCQKLIRLKLHRYGIPRKKYLQKPKESEAATTTDG